MGALEKALHPGGRLLVAVLLVAGVIGAWLVWRSTRGNPRQQFTAALAALESGDSAAAVRAIESLPEGPEFASRRALLRGGYLLKSGRPGAALADLSHAAGDAALQPSADRLLGECLYTLGRFTEAEAVFRRVLQQQPGDSGAHRWLAAIYYDLGAMDHALVQLDELARLEPDDFMPHRLKGLIYFDFEQYGPAAESYGAALARRPPADVAAEIRVQLVQSLVKQRRYDEALEAIEGAGTDPLLQVFAAECYWSLGRVDEAERALATARRQLPEHQKLLLLEARMAIDRGRPAEAIDSLRRALEDDPHCVECRYQLALAYRAMGDLERYESEMAKKAESEALLTRLTKLSNEAIERPYDADLRDRIAEVCEELGRQKLAETWRRAAAACRRRPAYEQ